MKKEYHDAFKDALDALWREMHNPIPSVMRLRGIHASLHSLWSLEWPKPETEKEELSEDERRIMRGPYWPLGL